MELTKELLEEGHDQVLSEHIVCQDALEQYFARQRDSTRGNNNPNMKEFSDNSLLFSVVKQATSGSRSQNTQCWKKPQMGYRQTIHRCHERNKSN